jgi:hypothetical protein
MSQAQYNPNIFTHGYNPDGLAPSIRLYDISNTLVYQYDSPQIAASPRQDFIITDWKLHAGLNSDKGNFVFHVRDDTGALLDKTDLNRFCKIKGQTRVDVYFGKNSAGLSRWWQGILQDPTFTLHDNGVISWEFHAIGKRIMLAERSTYIKVFQAMLSDGITPDKTDTSTYVSAIVSRMLATNKDGANPGLPNLPFTTNGVDSIPVTLVDYQKNMQSVDSCLSELANMGGCIYGDDGNGDIFLRQRGSKDSGMFFTNDLQYTNALNWNAAKFGVLRRFPMSWVDSTLGYGYSHYNGIGPMYNSMDQSQTSSNAVYDLSTNYFDIPFKPTNDNVAEFSLYLTRVGTPGNDMTIGLYPDDGTGKPAYSKPIKTWIVRKEILQGLSLTGQWYEFPFDAITVSPNVQYHFVITKYQDATNTIKLDYQTGAGSYFDSPDGTTWTSRTGNPKYRQYYANSVLLMLENTVARKTYASKAVNPAVQIRELNVVMNDIPNSAAAMQALVGFADVMGKQRRIYKPIIVSPPDVQIPLGQSARFRDKNTGLDINADIVSYDMKGDSITGVGGIGCKEISLQIEQVIYTT